MRLAGLNEYLLLRNSMEDVVIKYEGEVKWFDNGKGFGFINAIDDNGVVNEEVDYFVHFSSINAPGFKTLNEKQRVLFDLKETPKGLQAVDVEPI